MKLIFDENIHNDVILHYRNRGIHAISVKSDFRGSSDAEICSLSIKNKATIVTHDKDFGRLLLFDKESCYGLVFLRIQSLNPFEIISRLDSVFKKTNPRHKIITITEQKERVRYL